MTTGEPATAWQRLDTRVLAVHPVIDLAKLLPLLVVIAVTGGSGDDRWRLGLSTAAALLVLAHGASRWFTTTYRLTDDRVELRTGLLRRRHRSVRRDRIRTADLTATPVHRLLGLSVIRVGTGSREAGDDTELALDAVGHDEAERLRTVLLGGTPVPGAAAPPEPPEVARLRWAWVRFAPLTFSALAVVGAVWVAVFRVVEEFGWRPERVVRDAAGQAPVWLGAAALLLTAVGGAVVVFAEGWWGYRLTRADDGGVVLRRGLLTRRTLSLEGRRIRGVEIDEPLVLRLGRGARPMALTTGLPGPRSAGHGEHVGALSPAVPRAEALRIAAATIATPSATTIAAPLDVHPRAARTRRFVRGLVPAVVLVAAVTAAPWPNGVRLVAAVVVLAVGAALALDRWRALGHRLTDRHLVARHGSWLRRTVVVDRAGVIGWELSQGLTQRRTGLVTVHAVTAAGRGRYVVPDVAVDRGVAIVDATTPDLLAPFLDRSAQPARVLTRR